MKVFVNLTENLLKENFVKVIPFTPSEFVSFDHTNLDLSVTIFSISFTFVYIDLDQMMF